MKTYRTLKRGFTLVEILIVVIILGILAAIVIPQFTSASQDARKNSLTSQLQTIRSQIELYKLQHRDQLPNLVDATLKWSQLTEKTNELGTNVVADGEIKFGPYLQAAPNNSISGDPNTAMDVVDGNESTVPGSVGWVYDYSGGTGTGKFWAASKMGGHIYDEANPNNSLNDE